MPKTKRARKRTTTLSKLRKDITMLKKKNSHERSVKDDDFVTAVSTSTGNLINCFQTEQGDDYDQRNGLAIIAKSIHCNGLVQRMDSTNIVRIMVVQFESSADNSIANFLQYPNADATYLYRPVYSPFKVNGDCKYKILADKRYKVSLHRS